MNAGKYYLLRRREERMKIVTDQGDFEIPQDEKILGLTVLSSSTLLISTSKGLWRVETASGELVKLVDTDWKLERSLVEGFK
jgi:hypothetical protein